VLLGFDGAALVAGPVSVHGGFFAFGFDAFEEDGGGFVVPPLLASEFGLSGYEFAAERLGEDGLGELVGSLAGGVDTTLNFVSELEEGVNPADDFALFFGGRVAH